ncbi:very short patch repair endonuclease [Sulfuricaulis sp.]|uniref:very short patch repair endonuclease n=1 Tax=Sulfuricaulis sp. TaxID=2003553 RepID=UPI0034A1DF50
MDTLDRATRARVMSRNRSKGTKSTELRFRSLLVRSGIRGWKLGTRSGLPGTPDVVFRREKVAIFLDGCFWHGCSKCRSIPSTNRPFWVKKIGGNKKRDRYVVKQLKASGWKPLRLWEHDLRSGGAKVLAKVELVRRA